MSAIDDLFQSLRAANETALMPFVTAGDPDLAFTAEVLAELKRRGCHLCEVGIPYSDPVADGPVIQASYTRALEHKIKVPQIAEMLSGRSDAMPTVVMISYAILFRRGLEASIRQWKEAGVAGAIVPDLLTEEADELAAICRREDFSLIQLVTPTTPRDRALRIAETSSGFLYFVSTTGITGERNDLPPELTDNVAWLREKVDLPICIGFGISSAETARRLTEVADGLIVGSAFVRRIAQASDQPREAVLTEVGEFASELLAAMKY
ncbi:MAG: tryptophan synthase subunit alpha [bacterium]|nr:tryptophan synthase subunit alpha [bacterium]